MDRFQTMRRVAEYAVDVERQIVRRDGTPTRFCGYKFVRDTTSQKITKCALRRVMGVHDESYLSACENDRAITETLL